MHVVFFYHARQLVEQGTNNKLNRKYYLNPNPNPVDGCYIISQ